MKTNSINKNGNKVVLAFSGGLDTSFCVPYLTEKGYEVITVTVDSGGLSIEEKKEIEEKSKKLGAVKHYLVDAKKYYFDSMLQWIIKTNGLYEGSYPNLVSSQRYHLVEKCLEIAKKEGAHYFANGNSGTGNDQIRFNITAKILSQNIEVIEPIKDTGGNREEEKLFLLKKGFPVNNSHKKYSINISLAGISYSGSEIDQNLEPNEGIFQWVTGEKVKEKVYFEIEFKEGIPVKLNNKELEGWEIINYLNENVGKYGFGKGYYTGDCMIGIKGHLVFEAPGLLFLIAAHKALEQYVLTKSQIYFSESVAKEFTEMIYNGKFYDPHVKNLKTFLDSQQENVSGTVLMKIEYGNALAVSVKTNNSLIDPKIAVYAQSKSWTKEEVNGFIKLYGLHTIIATKKQGEKKGGNSI